MQSPDGAVGGSRGSILGRRGLLALGAGAVGAGMVGYGRGAMAADRGKPALRVVASFSILADLARVVAGPAVEVESLAPLGVELHHFQPSPADVRGLVGAAVFVTNGLGLEGWVDRFVEAAGFKGQRVVASTGVRPLPADHDHAEQEAAGHKHAAAAGADGGFDPHAWQDVANVRLYVANIRDGMIAADPAGAAGYRERAAAYLQQLEALDAEVRSILGRIPPAKRRVVTTHEAFNYYGRAYGVTFLAPVGLTSEQEPTPRAFAALIRQVRKEHIRALFLEAGMPPRMLEQIAQETGVRIGGTLYAETLTEPGGPAPTYIDMMRVNTREIAAALR